MPRISNAPKVLVLMTTYNGVNWIDEQIRSVINQQGVKVNVLISDDSSIDGTAECLDSIAKSNSVVKVLHSRDKFRSAGKNFYYLLNSIDPKSYAYFAFCDQDDIWSAIKLISHINLIKKYNAEGVSSDVIAFWQNGRHRIITKSQPQRKLDYLFESAGPGCTFLMTPWLVSQIKLQLTDVDSPAKDVALHDWLTYAICRAHNRKWVIDTTPTVLYRQHQHNVLGANSGIRAAISRLTKFRNGWYRAEVAKVAEVCLRIRDNEEIRNIANLIQDRSLIGRLQILAYMPQARRKFLDRVFLSLLILFF